MPLGTFALTTTRYGQRVAFTRPERFIMDNTQRLLLNRRFREAASQQPAFRELRRLLHGFGGTHLVAPAGPEPDLQLLISAGFVMAGPVVQRAVRENRCHQNIAEVWAEKLGMDSSASVPDIRSAMTVFGVSIHGAFDAEEFLKQRCHEWKYFWCPASARARRCVRGGEPSWHRDASGDLRRELRRLPDEMIACWGASEDELMGECRGIRQAASEKKRKCQFNALVVDA